MEDGYIPISTLNDFIFCPYSIYLHNVYMETDESIYHALPQVKGRIAHEATDTKRYSTRKGDLMALSVYSDELGVMGKIDLYKADGRVLIERKYMLKQIYRGQLYQLWAEYFCMQEMGYQVDKIAFYEVSANKMIFVELPGKDQKRELIEFIRAFRRFSPELPIVINRNKCTHCIYCNLCDKTNSDNVYT